MLRKKLSLLAVFSALLLTVTFTAHAAVPEGNAGMLRLSIPFGAEEKSYEPWLGFSLSHRDSASSYVPLEKKDEGMETAVSFNLAAPEMALTSNDVRTVLSFVKPTERRASIGCGGPDPVQHHDTHSDSVNKLLLAAGGAVVVGTAVYFLINSDTQIWGC